MGTYKNNNGTLERIAGATFYADNPIGTILAFGGSDIPVGWHLCDGTAVSRTAYAELFAIIGTNFGVGDGSTTFNLPDLQGEFLRGAGTNSHSGQGNGGLVGEHQDATEIPRIKETSSGLYGFYVSGEEADYRNIDSVISVATNINNHSASASGTSSDVSATFTSRPTNTSVNYIIKMKPVMFPSDVLSQIGDALSYSTAEKLTGGRWIDGKPIYSRTISCGALGNGTHNIETLTVEEVKFIKGFVVAQNDASNMRPLPLPDYSASTIRVDVTDGVLRIITYSSWSGYDAYLTIEYTKTTD